MYNIYKKLLYNLFIMTIYFYLEKCYNNCSSKELEERYNMTQNLIDYCKRKSYIYQLRHANDLDYIIIVLNSFYNRKLRVYIDYLYNEIEMIYLDDSVCVSFDEFNISMIDVLINKRV